MKLIIPGRLPGLNEIIAAERTNKYKGAALKRDAGALVSACIRQQLQGYRPRTPVEMRYLWIEPNRRRDKDNISSGGRKIIQDALVRCGVLADDGWPEISGFSDAFGVDKGHPRVEVEILEAETC